jgi:DNA-binding protein HU-beta
MGKEIIGKEKLAAAISVTAGVSKSTALKVLDAFKLEVSHALEVGDEVRLTGFGTFSTASRKARIGVKPGTGEKITIPAKTVPVFHASQALKETVK